MKKPENLKQLIDQIEEQSKAKSLSDGYLEANGHSARMIGEFQYGVVLIPEDWVLPYLKKFLSLSEQL